MKQYLEAGKITRTHGVRGELVMEIWADSQIGRASCRERV